MTLWDVYCQDRAIGALQRAFGAGKLAHAYIFAGADGVGKFTTARQWAKMLLCDNRTEKKAPDPFIDGAEENRGAGVFYDSCGQCRSCEVFEGGAHPDFKVIYKELVKFTKKGKNKSTPIDLPIDVIREFLIDKVSSRPMLSEHTVYVVREAERLNKESQNALLKVLEEPPGYCFIILLCSRAERLLPTTLSRCQVLRFGPVDEARIVAKLEEMGVGGSEARYWARFSRGSIGAAMNWAQLELSDNSCYEIKRELVDRLASHELGKSVEFSEWVSAAAKKISTVWANKEPDTSKKAITRRAQKGLIRMIIAVFDDVMQAALGKGELINSDQAAQIKTLGGLFDAEQAAEKIRKAYENMRWVEASVNEKLVFEELLLNLGGCGIINGVRV